ncbi:ABC transporter ATP-binding protein [Baekduia soli]|uniref:ABC transporter ATP-binding protein n=1 Tax=Baekduia soli TaxID=496014 RepID=A0A5B8U1P6_9ACTN|nr:ABC transporter ATP-binding protein [Baekduia soli]QEC46745.1 ABC transporter ATP-binding protein [Baekduia soli]
MSDGEEASPGADGPPPGGARVVAQGLRRDHGHGILALDGVDLTLEPGEFVALTGPSGSGKTTLLSLIGALDRPTSGSIAVDGVALHDHDFDRARYHQEVVGFVFQHHHLLTHLSARANVELPLVPTMHRRTARRARAAELLEEVDLGPRVGELAAHLSGGERQRVAVARALANEPRLLLADEPTGALDSAAAHRVLDLIADVRARRGTTVLVVTHDPLVAARADRVLHLHDGRLVDRPAELRAGSEQLSA